MRASWRFLMPGLAVLLAVCAGCSSTPSAPPPKSTASFSLIELLGKPRSELAALTDEWLEKARLQEKAHREGRMPYSLLPDLRLPFVLPVLKEAKYSAQAGFSLPPYTAEGARDPDLALLYAKHGDVAAARKLIDPADGEALRRVEGYACARNYPVEWTRLVGVIMHVAEMNVATSDQNSGADLMAWHQELAKLLDEKARQGTLGTVLLSRGREVLGRAATAWQKENQSTIADKVRQSLASWGNVPPPATLPLGAGRAEAAKLLQPAADGGNSGRVTVAGNITRALDPRRLPLPADPVDSLLAFSDEQGRLSEVLVVFRNHTTDLFPRSTDVALRYEEQVGADGKLTERDGLPWTAYTVGPQTCEVTMIARSSEAGGLARWFGPATASTPALPRDFKAVSLDRSFEQNRVQVNPGQRGDSVS